MGIRLAARVGLLLAVTLGAADQPTWLSAELEDVEVRTRLMRESSEIRALLGTDLDREYIVLEMEVRPLYNTKLYLTRDDFLLRSYRDNDRSFAQSPELIAGSSVLVMGSNRVKRGGGVFSESREPVIVGGAPGTGSRPRSLGNPSNIGVGGGSTTAISTELSEREQPATSLLERLARLELPMGETREPVRGYLFFQLDPKTKPKHLVLTYDGTAGECKILFKKK